MNILRISILASALGILFLSGCKTVRRVDPDTTEGLMTVHDLDFKDFQITAEGLINKLLSSGRLESHTKDGPAVIMVSTIRNSTTQHIDTQLLTQRITIALDKSETVVQQQPTVDADHSIRQQPKDGTLQTPN